MELPPPDLEQEAGTRGSRSGSRSKVNLANGEASQLFGGSRSGVGDSSQWGSGSRSGGSYTSQWLGGSISGGCGSSQWCGGR